MKFVFLFLLTLCSSCWGLEQVVVQGEHAKSPGRAVPHKSVDAQAFYVAWGDGEEERSYIVIEPGDGVRRPVIIATMDGETQRMRVSYAGTAFIDKAGNIHIDARQARIHGPDRNRWSPDSFMIGKDGRVKWMDDALRNGTGRVLGWAPKDAKKGEKAPAAFQKLKQYNDYKIMRLMSRFYMDGVL